MIFYDKPSSQRLRHPLHYTMNVKILINSKLRRVRSLTELPSESGSEVIWLMSDESLCKGSKRFFLLISFIFTLSPLTPCTHTHTFYDLLGANFNWIYLHNLLCLLLKMPQTQLLSHRGNICFPFNWFSLCQHKSTLDSIDVKKKKSSSEARKFLIWKLGHE